MSEGAKTLVFDTETNDRMGKEAPELVQLAAILFDEDRKEVASIACPIMPDGWTVADGAAGVHGITTEMAKANGLYLEDVTYIFTRMVEIAGHLVCHNTPFDAAVMRKVVDKEMDAEKTFKDKTWRCTMRASTPIVRIPKTSRTKSNAFKWPKLAEAYRFFFGEDLDGAHDALVDARATARIYFHLLDMGDNVDWKATN